MSKEEIFAICKSMNVEQIAKTYSKSELQTMFSVLYGDIVCKGNKIDIAYKLYDFYSSEIRTLDLIKNLY